jgi:hypothetical protein
VTRLSVTVDGVCEHREWRPGSFEYDQRAAQLRAEENATQLSLLEVAKKVEKRFASDNRSRRLHVLTKEDEAEVREEQALLLKLFQLEREAAERQKPASRMTFAERRALLMTRTEQSDEVAPRDVVDTNDSRGMPKQSERAVSVKKTWSPGLSRYEYEML